MSPSPTCITSGVFCLLAVAFGVAQGDLIAAMAGAFFGLAYTKPVHWGDWLTVPRTESRIANAYYWARRIIIVAFILLATAVLCTIVAQGAQVAAAEGATLVPAWLAKINSKALALICSACGQYFIPRLFKWGAARIKGAQP